MNSPSLEIRGGWPWQHRSRPWGFSGLGHSRAKPPALPKEGVAGHHPAAIGWQICTQKKRAEEGAVRRRGAARARGAGTRRRCGIKPRQEGGFLVAAFSGGQRLNKTKKKSWLLLFIFSRANFFRGWEAAFQGRSLEDAGSRSRASTQNGFEQGGGDGS